MRFLSYRKSILIPLYQRVAQHMPESMDEQRGYLVSFGEAETIIDKPQTTP